MTLMQFVKIGCRLIVASVVGLGLATIVVGTALGLIAAYRLNIIQAWLPKEQVRQLETVSLQISGPKFAVLGDRVYFHASASGVNSKISWNIHPYRAGILHVMEDDSRNVEFSSLEEGKYVITAAVAGEGKQPPATDHIEFENVTLSTEAEVNQQQPVRTMGQMQAEGMPPPVPQELPPTTTELTQGALAMVTSSNKAYEARLVADVIYSLAKQIRGGLIPAYLDVPLEIEKRSSKALGERAADWGTFMVATDRIMDEMRRQGKITAVTATQADVLVEMANVLVGLR